MKKDAFIITLTGPSACGKTYITNKILEMGDQLRQEGIVFNPIRFFKYVTRPFRETEVIEKNRGLDIDVESVRTIPTGREGCELVYRTYGDEYGLKTKDLSMLLTEGKSPIVVINDVRVVEELKKVFKGKVLSLFIFREIIPDVETHKKVGSDRGGSTEKKSITRFEKAIALYRVFIENIYIYDRVILNVKYEGDTLNGNNFENIAFIQTENIIRGVLNGEIALNKMISKGPKLFIISGNAASGKDDIIKAANAMGGLQTEILIKHSSRWQEIDDQKEIICKYIPKKNILFNLTKIYELQISHFRKLFTYEYYNSKHINECKNDYNNKNADFKKLYSFEEYCRAKYLIHKLKHENGFSTGIEKFWKILQREQYNRSTSSQNDIPKKLLPENEYVFLRDHYFEINSEYLDLELLKNSCADQMQNEMSKIADKSENPSYLLKQNTREFILYENNSLYKKPVNYGFEIGIIKDTWKERKKHIVLTASLPNIFRICKEIIGKENVVTAFTYSQISQDELLAHSDKVMGQAKLKEYEDILRYANHIVDFDYALIYAETSLVNSSGNQKNELVDQIFRLFRVYNE